MACREREQDPYPKRVGSVAAVLLGLLGEGLGVDLEPLERALVALGLKARGDLAPHLKKKSGRGTQAV